MDQHHEECPTCIPACVENDQFCTPCDCPEQIPTPRYSAPTRVLPIREHEELKECIHEVNELLLALARHPNSHDQLELWRKFRTLLNQFVSVTVLCDHEEVKVKGIVKDVGRDFIALDDFDQKTFILFEKICSVQHHETKEAHQLHEGELAHLDICSKRELVLNFGEVVSKSPFLLNLFFGLNLDVFLLEFVDCHIRLVLENEEIEGVLLDTDREQLLIKTKEGKEKMILENICFMIIDKK
jgi:hypothetical protein